MPTSMFASETENIKKADELSLNVENSSLSYCEIIDKRGFYGKGRCKVVMRNYRMWLAMQ